MNIKLIAPHDQRDSFLSVPFKFRRVNLPLLAALTPPDHNVTIVEEVVSPDDINQDVDLVGITVLTELASRAYDIAHVYRRKGVKVVMGGVHPTVLPEEALEHADTVVVGEAESVWPRLLSDAAKGQMQRLYRADTFTNLKGLPWPLRDILPMRSFLPIPVGIETTRGCPYGCEFCCIGKTMGHQYRTRPVPEVIAEIESIDSPYIFFIDDAIGLNRTTAKELFTKMIPLKRRWVGQTTVSLAEDLELLKLMKRSGCMGLLIGFESVQKATQDHLRKLHSLKIDFSEAMRRFHGEGISIIGSFVFGFDYEDSDVFEQTFNFIMNSRIDCVQMTMFIPLPGTQLYNRLVGENRLFVHDWWLRGYPHDTLLFRPKNMTPYKLINGVRRLRQQTYSFGGILKRFFGMNPLKRTMLGCQAYTGTNLLARKLYRKRQRITQPFGESCHLTNSIQ